MSAQHPALHLDSLKSLPRDARIIVSAFRAERCTPRDLIRFERLLNTSKNIVPLICVLYETLDPLRIPQNSDDIENAVVEPSTMTLPKIVIALRAVPKSPRSKDHAEATFHVWKRALRWMVFLITYEEQVKSRLGPTPLRDLCVEFFQFTNMFNVLNGWKLSFGDFTDSPGFYTIFFHAWPGILLLRDKSPIQTGYERTIQFASLGIYLAPDKITPPILDEMILGAGGTIGDLGKLFLAHFRMAAEPSLIQSMSASSLTTPVLECIQHVNALRPAKSSADLPPLLASILLNGGIPVLTRLTSTLKDTSPIDFSRLGNLDEPGPSPERERMAKLAFDMLRQLLTRPFTYPDRVVKAVENELLISIAKWASSDVAEGLYCELNDMLLNVLLPSAAYYSVLCALEKALAISTLTEETRSELFVNSNVFGAWSRFEAAVRRLLALKEKFDDSERPLTMAVCDNLKCAKLQQKSVLRRCANCLAFRYCSRDCQQVEWVEGGHKRVCEAYRDARSDLRETFGRRNVAFFRFIVYSEYTAARASIHFQRALVESATQNDASTPLMVVFELNASPAVQVVALGEEFVAQLCRHDRLLEDKLHRARSLKHEGGVVFCALRLGVPGDGEANVLVVPVHAPTCSWDGLSSAILSDLKSGSDEERAREFSVQLAATTRGVEVVEVLW